MTSQRGYTFLAMLALVAISALGLAVAGPRWSDQLRRERELEMLKIGALYAEALTRYREQAPGTLKEFPLQLEDLLVDPRYAGMRRYIRELYPDPVNQNRAWQAIRNIDQRVIGVRSLSDEAPLAEGVVEIGVVKLAPARRYSEWLFIAKGAS